MSNVRELFEGEGVEDGWSETFFDEFLTVMEDLEDLRYEIENAVRTTTPKEIVGRIKDAIQRLDTFSEMVCEMDGYDVFGDKLEVDEK